MASNEVRRNYSMSNAELCMICSNLISVLNRDLSEMAVFGVTTATVTAFKNLGNDFEMFPSDDFMLGDIMVATEAKNLKKEELKELIRQMAARAEAKWGTNSTQYQRLRITGMNDFTDIQLLGLARTLLLTMTKYQTDLVSLGLTQAVLDAYKDKIDEFEGTINNQSEAVSLRDTKTKERIAMGNQLYEQLLSFCNFGKILYERANPAKYKDYVIYGSGGSTTLTAPTDFSFNGSDKNFVWSAVENATSYQVEMSVDNVVFVEIYAGADTFFNFTPEANVKRYYRVRARNSAGYGPFCDVITAWYWTAIPAPKNLQVVWSADDPNNVKISVDPIEGVERYAYYKSVVPIGSPISDWTGLGTDTSNVKIVTADRQKRMYIKVIAQVYYLRGAETTPVYVDVN